LTRETLSARDRCRIDPVWRIQRIGVVVLALFACGDGEKKVGADCDVPGATYPACIGYPGIDGGGAIRGDTGTDVDPPVFSIRASPAALLLHPGQSAPTTVFVEHGRDEVVTVAVDATIPGVTATSIGLDGGTATGEIEFTAAEDAGAVAMTVNLVATAASRSASTPIRVDVLAGSADADAGDDDGAADAGDDGPDGG
jgi:hypothetical protein